MNVVLHHWPLIAAVVAASVAFGGQQVQIKSLEEAVKAQAEMQVQAARVDERTKAILEEQRRQREMLERLLQER